MLYLKGCNIHEMVKLLKETWGRNRIVNSRRASLLGWQFQIIKVTEMSTLKTKELRDKDHLKLRGIRHLAISAMREMEQS